LPALYAAYRIGIENGVILRCLNAIFTYNRPHLLRNCIKSFFEFGPEGDLIVVDDGSTKPDQLSYLQELARLNNPFLSISIWNMTRNDRNKLGGLYTNMEAVAQYATVNGYDFLFFIQDDQQFMWKDPFFWTKVSDTYGHHPQALIVRPVFDKLIFSHDAPNRLENCPKCNGILFKKSWFAAVGIVRPAHIKALGWHFCATEGLNNQQAKSLNLTMHLTKSPVLAFVPMPETWRFGHNTRAPIRPARDYFLKPLSAEQIVRLTHTSNVAYLEEYCRPWGWKAWSPYNFSDNRRKHMQNLWRWFKKNRLRRWPKRQGMA
jgi:hypothetical protein